MRVVRGLSQEQLGRMAGVSFQQVQKYEKGTNGLSPSKMKLFAESLGVTVNHLYGLTDMELPHIENHHRKLLRLLQALQQIEQQHPKAFALLYSYITGLAGATET